MLSTASGPDAAICLHQTKRGALADLILREIISLHVHSSCLFPLPTILNQI